MDALADGALERFRPHLHDAFEAAEMVIRQRVAEEIAAALEYATIPPGHDDVEFSSALTYAAGVARMIGNR